MLVRGGQELEVVQEDQHFSAHYQVRGDAEDRVRTSVLGRWGGNRVDATSGEHGGGVFPSPQLHYLGPHQKVAPREPRKLNY